MIEVFGMVMMMFAGGALVFEIAYRTGMRIVRGLEVMERADVDRQ